MISNPVPHSKHAAGEFRLLRAPLTLAVSFQPLTQPLLRMSYYSHSEYGDTPKRGVIFCGPSGIRTHDLLNAIETRSQLRHGP